MKIAINSKTTGKFEKKFLNNREHIVTSMCSIVGNSVMNDGLYPLIEVKNSYQQLHFLPAPCGHPKIGNELISAFHPLATNAFNIGGMIRNPKMEGNNVINEFWLDIEIANQSEDGKELIKRIENGEEVGVSTGLSVDQEMKVGNQDGFDYTWIANNLNFDHVAILLNEEAAGAHVGTKLVNSTGDNVQVVNCAVLGADIKGSLEVTNDEGIINKILSGVKNLIKGNAIEMHSLSDQLRNQVKSIFPDDNFWVWVMALFPTESTVVIEIENKTTNLITLVKFSYSVDQNDQVSLNDDGIIVIKKVEFVKVDGDVNANNSNPKEDNDMGKDNKPGGQDVTNNDKLTVENAINLLEEKGFKVNTKKEADQLQYFIDNKAKFESVINAEETELKSIREALVANSDMTEDDVKDMSKDMLTRLSNSLNPKQNYSAQANSSPGNVNSSEASDEDFEDSYVSDFEDKEGGDE